MFFHCTEATEHKDKHKMVPLTQWLEWWANSDCTGNCPNHEFECYAARNAMSIRVWERKSVAWEDDLPSSLARTGEMKKSLQSKYKGVGISEELERSACVFSIILHSRVPSRCDCTAGVPAQHASTRPVATQWWDVLVPGFLRSGYKKSHNHGVTHSGSTFVTTPEQDALIDAITREDQVSCFLSCMPSIFPHLPNVF
jgi:hypothetical protein